MKAPRPLLWLLLVLAASVLTLHAHGLAQAQVGQDLTTYWTAVHAAFAGQDPFDSTVLGTTFTELTGRERAVRPFLYPPPFLLLASGLALFDDLATTVTVWTLGTAVATTLLGLRLARLAGLSPLAGLALAWLFGPTHDNLRMGQVNPWVVLLVVEAFQRRNAAWLSVGALVKVAPAIGLPVLLASETRRTDTAPHRALLRQLGWVLAGAVPLVVLSLLLFGPALHQTFVEQLLGATRDATYAEHGFLPITAPNNHGLSRYLAMLGADPHAISPRARALGASILALLGLAACARAWRDGPGRTGLHAGAAGALMILAAPRAWETHLVLALPAVAVLFGRWADLGRWGRRLLVLCWAALAAPPGWWQPLTWYLPDARLLLSSLKSLAVFLLLLWCLRPPAATGRSGRPPQNT